MDAASLVRVYENFVVWDFSPVRRSHSTRYEPARQALLSRLNIVATYSRQVSRDISLTRKRTFTEVYWTVLTLKRPLLYLCCVEQQTSEKI
jgi:hypothetical protein